VSSMCSERRVGNQRRCVDRRGKRVRREDFPLKERRFITKEKGRDGPDFPHLLHLWPWGRTVSGNLWLLRCHAEGPKREWPISLAHGLGSAP